MNKTKEQIVQEMQQKKQMEEMMEKNKKIQSLVKDLLIPTLSKETPTLLEAGKLSNYLNQLVNQAASGM